MLARRILDTIADVLTLLALAVAGVGLFMPWFSYSQPAKPRPAPVAEAAKSSAPSSSAEAAGDPLCPADPKELLIEYQMWHVARSGAALVVAAVLVFTSLTTGLGCGGRKILVLAMFASVLAAVAFQAMVFTPLPISRIHREVAEIPWREQEGLLVALVPSVIAGVLCLARMLWTMLLPVRPPDGQSEPLEIPQFDRPKA